MRLLLTLLSGAQLFRHFGGARLPPRLVARLLRAQRLCPQSLRGLAFDLQCSTLLLDRQLLLLVRATQRNFFRAKRCLALPLFGGESRFLFT